jgi:multidrug resistance efflux pump
VSSLPALVFADEISVRFPFSGRLIKVFKKAGDQVNRGEPLAQLDPKILQVELDRELADYEKVRARFEIFAREHPDVTDDTVKYLKIISQAELNSAVKAVEIAKNRLDQARLLSPVKGLVVSDGGCRAGLYATPASNAFVILDADSLRLRVELSEYDQSDQSDQSDLSYSVSVAGQNISLTPSALLPAGKNFTRDFYPAAPLDLPVGLSVDISIVSP